MKTQLNRRPRRMKLTTAALALFLGVSAPLAAQSTHRVHSDRLLVQNNRDVPVQVFLNTTPVDMKLGTIGPFQSAMMTIPSWVVRHDGTVDVFAIPDGQIALKGEAALQDGGPNFAMVIPPSGDQKVKIPAPSLATLLYPPVVTTVNVDFTED